MEIFDNPTQYTGFGGSLALSGTAVLVGAPLDNTLEERAGAAYIFDANDSNEPVHTLTSPTLTRGGQFGQAIATVGNYVVVSEGLRDGAFDSGEVHIFEASTGQHVRSFPSPNPTSDDQFGWSVAILGSDILVGARAADVGDVAEAGAVHLFDLTSGRRLRTYPNPDPDLRDRFGDAITAVGTDILVGAFAADGPNNDRAQTGVAYLIHGTSGAVLQTFHNPTLEVGEGFGASVASVDGDLVITKGGAAYHYVQENTLADIPFERRPNELGLNTAYSLGFVNDSLRIHLKLRLIGDDPGDAIKARWEHGAEKIWNNQFFAQDSDNRFPILLDVEFVDSNADATIEVFDECGVFGTSSPTSTWYTDVARGLDILVGQRHLVAWICCKL